ncbi:GntR family transcriptional regulator [Frondihabitans cladoniiphilus]|uniref:HTH gntR-type domain-containing protein n=1 Tax=Frondihabitans cladoniiphilus TaxID=715785 RepID=A0ABP8VHS3_9MICO
MTAFVVEHDSPLTVWGQIHRDLRRRIDSSEFRPGARIPTEVDLMAHYDVSRVTIRRALSALIDDGYLRTRRGSGTYVTDRTVALVCDLDLARPWREQLLADGHEARVRLVETRRGVDLPDDVARTFDGRVPSEPLTFALTVHVVDGIPIGVTESWHSERWRAAVAGAGVAGVGSPRARSASEAVVADCFAEVGFATSLQAKLLDSYLDIPLIVVHARSRMAATGELAEFARTSWLGSRVRLAYVRKLTLGEIDIAQLIGSGEVEPE